MLHEIAQKGLLPATQMFASCLSSELPLSLSLLLLLLQILGARSQDLAVLQTQGPLMLTAGDTLSLNCTLTGFGPPGSIRWYKDTDRGQPPVYYDKVATPPRLVRVVPGSNTDYSILIHDIQPKDAGTYYCVKFKAGSPETEYKSGRGTEVLVIAPPSQPSISGPPSRVGLGASVTFNCTSDGFFPQDITVTWLKNGRNIPASNTFILTPRESSSYQVVSTVEVDITEKDVKSELTCQIQHSTLHGRRLQQSFKLGDALRVAPKMSIEPGHLVEVAVNQLVTLICSAKGFYPNDTSLVWIGTNSEFDLGIAEPVTQDQDGMFSVKSSLEVNMTEQRSYSVFTCYAVSAYRTFNHMNVILKLNHEGTADHDGAGQQLLSSLVVWAMFVLNKIVAAFLLSFLFLRKIHSRMNQGQAAAAPYEMRHRESPVKQ